LTNRSQIAPISARESCEWTQIWMSGFANIRAIRGQLILSILELPHFGCGQRPRRERLFILLPFDGV
jgi:hypothetical protein